ncbi:MAG: hypothetical protein Fur0037_04170 [Planctomycetota bacterium]
MKRLATVLLLLLGGAWVPPRVPAQDEPAASKQELARTQFRQIHDRMQKLHATLAKKKEAKDDADVLRRGLLFVQEAKIREGLDRVKEQLDKEQWSEALDGMKAVRADFTKLLDLLQNRNMDLARLLEQIARLEKFRNRVDKLVKEQGDEKEASARAESLQKQMAEIEKARADVEKLLARQRTVRDRTNDLGLEAAAEQAKPVAQQQGGLREDTSKLAQKLKDIEEKIADAREQKPGSNSSTSSASSASAGRAASSMGQAEKSLGENKPESALKDQDRAIDLLENTRKTLDDLAEDVRRELEKLPFEQLAKRQDETRHATDTLAEDMEKSEEKGENGDGAPTPGRKNVQQAVPKQKAAAGTLKERKPGRAKQDQQDAKEDLENARQELEEALAQLRQQLQEEVLRALEERFTAMLARQRELSETTRVVDKSRRNVLTATGGLPGALVERCREIAGGETDLAVECGDAGKLLEEDGTSAVIPEIVADLHEQLRDVAVEIRGNDTGLPVQGHQRDIEDTLALLINALRRAIEHKEGGG